MTILLVFDKPFLIDQRKLKTFLEQHLSYVNFTFYNSELVLNETVISEETIASSLKVKLGDLPNKYQRVYCFTHKPYSDNYFTHVVGNITLMSFYQWNYYTDLPLSNGVVFFIARRIARTIDASEFRHQETTGCINDFLGDKKGVDDGMRQARFCPNCLDRISSKLNNEVQLSLFEDLKKIMNILSDASRWNKDILEKVEIIKTTVPIIKKRKIKNKKGVQVVIASPGDTETERKILLELLERKFRVNNHEDHCGFRIIVNGWEDIASQNGYAQDIINKNIIAECDFVVAVFKHRLGTPTIDIETNIERAPSGSAEELLQAIEKGNHNHPIGMAYFFSKAPVISLDLPEKDAIEKEWKRLTDFKKSIQNQMIYKPYTEAPELLELVLRDLEKNIIDYIETQQTA
jgi:hypothetical protein